MRLRIKRAEQNLLEGLIFEVADEIKAEEINGGEHFLAEEDFIGNVSRRVLNDIMGENIAGTLLVEEVN